jgi:hypothetical protein
MDLDGIQRAIMGKMSWLVRLICCLLDSSTTKPIGGIFAYFGRIQIVICGERITINQTLIAK